MAPLVEIYEESEWYTQTPSILPIKSLSRQYFETLLVEPYADIVELNRKTPFPCNKNRTIRHGCPSSKIPSVIIPVTCVLGTSVGRHLMDSRNIPLNWRSRINPIVDPHFSAATLQPLNFMEVVLLNKRMRDLRVRTWFGIFEKLDLRCCWVPLLWTGF